ncbi:MAG: efflux RND transporter periplasmic adaptor subunit [Xanthomonadales bacterium]|nr:efflux RND transporter periplasmic adaptor subunit [Xanthomonadales bacterium]
MDRKINPHLQRRRRTITVLKGVGIGVLLLFSFIGLRAAITPSVDVNELRTATVERGEMVAAIDVTGVFVPRNETVVSAAFASEVRAIMAPPGTSVAAGDALLRVEHRSLDVAISELQEKLALKENERKTRRLELDQALSEAEGNRALLEIDLESRKTRAERLEQLAGIGAISKGDLEEARLDVRRSEVELAQLNRRIDNQRLSHQAQLEKIDLETSILQQQLAEQERLRELATVRAPHAGVVTWVLEEPGASVGLGAPLARVADLSTYRVEATVSDFYATEVAEGQIARVSAAGQELEAQVASVLPAVEQGSIKVLLDLVDPDADGLRPQLRADVQLVTDQSKDTLYVRRGPGVPGRGRNELYLIDGSEAVRTPVLLGFSNRSQIQVLEGLEIGDRIIVSATTEFNHLDTIDLEGIQ